MIKKVIAGSFLLFLLHLSLGRKPAPMCRDTDAALGRGPRGEELRSPAKSQNRVANHVSRPPWGTSRVDDRHSGPPVLCNLMKDPMLGLISWMPNSRKLYEITHVYGFKQLSFGILDDHKNNKSLQIFNPQF